MRVLQPYGKAQNSAYGVGQNHFSAFCTGPLRQFIRKPVIMQALQQTRLNHLSFPSSDAVASSQFFVKFLGCQLVLQGQHTLLKRHDFDIVIEQIEATDEPAGPAVPQWPATFHFGLEFATLAELQQAYHYFQDQGVMMETGLFNNSRGSRFFCRAPGGILIELNTREDLDQEKWRQLFAS